MELEPRCLLQERSAPQRRDLAPQRGGGLGRSRQGQAAEAQPRNRGQDEDKNDADDSAR